MYIHAYLTTPGLAVTCACLQQAAACLQMSWMWPFYLFRFNNFFPVGLAGQQIPLIRHQQPVLWIY